MRWLKHLSQAHNDPAICEILEEFGAVGYGIYWLLLEEFAAVVERDSVKIPSLTHSELKWSQICQTSVRTFRKFTLRASKLRLIECKSAAELVQFSSRSRAIRMQIDVPKLLKYRDEYSQRSGHSQVQRREDKSREYKTAAVVSTPKKAPPPFTRTELARKMLQSYPGANAIPNEPDDEIVEKCIALAGDDLERLQSALLRMAKNGKRPEKTWGYFTKLLPSHLTSNGNKL